MVDMGVLNSCVILLMKSFFISDSFFCLNARMIVSVKITRRIMVKANAGIINFIDEKMNFFISGKYTFMKCLRKSGSFGNRVCVNVPSSPASGL